MIPFDLMWYFRKGSELTLLIWQESEVWQDAI
jgi:hypothetical protein